MTTAAQRGTTTVSGKAVRRIAEQAASEALADRGATAVRGLAKGSADVRGRRADVAVDVSLPYPAPVAEAVRRLQEHVASRTRQLTGLDVARPRVGVTALTPLPADGTATAQKGTPAHVRTAATSGTRTPRRWWSQRRLPMTLVTLAAAVAAGALAFDMVMVHTAHRPAAVWRTGILHWSAGHGPGDPGVVVASGAVAVLGLLLIVLALTPGHRALLTIACDPRLGAAVDRRAVAALVRDAVAATAGIDAVTVRVRRRRVAVRAHLAFGDRATARDKAREAARRTLEECSLRRVPRLRVTVRPRPSWDPATTLAPDGRDAPGVQPTGTVPEGANP
ncbi:Asp23/Gls24 family envelope stress response protein [Streptomyces sp. NBC_01478]|uniref:DUF6286 domain-containing Asp23/Gls24 family envelope stress response protein n=1 Tax=Streptomyces sp. NBC_01478 TaxID=2903882 RepID=UPI002E367AA2|nr:DUF6286 domain-containing Asp23/Gls24 family envelope stress response protein [Streptomyces sp. NBC_01478]